MWQDSRSLERVCLTLRSSLAVAAPPVDGHGTAAPPFHNPE
jgi:hypothetical protein